MVKMPLEYNFFDVVDAIGAANVNAMKVNGMENERILTFIRVFVEKLALLCDSVLTCSSLFGRLLCGANKRKQKYTNEIHSNECFIIKKIFLFCC